jgi:hypothetical protein
MLDPVAAESAKSSHIQHRADDLEPVNGWLSSARLHLYISTISIVGWSR